MEGKTQIPAHEIVIAQTKEEIQECYDVRITVFHIEQKFPLETEIDEYDSTATHFLLRLTPSLTPVGTIRANHTPGGYYKLSRLAVLKEYRNFKFGGALVLALHAWVKAHAAALGVDASGSAEIVCHSQLPVKGFYVKFGYEPQVRCVPPIAASLDSNEISDRQGAEFDEEGDPHQKMVLRLPL
ncbi:hypothetical protein H0H81_011579 [Sphagnurus paluster]|uniref:N-acetyltransferase domain-containing protein n=1 Tax=Sphagnurus paluster TaxID=117069 RepID=A0A9P7GRC0_9AGAR|nr:hypothetical protein H0H81_011579 [Sphagnurus paluster]